MKEKIDKVFNAMKRIKPHTYVSIVMVVIAVINYALTAMGKPIISLGEDVVTYAVNNILNLLFIGYAAWKNNSLSDNAILADDVLYMLRDGKISKEELEQFISDHKSDEVPVE